MVSSVHYVQRVVLVCLLDIPDLRTQLTGQVLLLGSSRRGVNTINVGFFVPG